MLKRFLKGLGIAFACSYALAAPQNTIFLHKASAEEITQYTTLEEMILEEDDNIRFNYTFDVFAKENAQIKIEIYNEYETYNDIILNISYPNSLIKLFIGGFDNSNTLEQGNVPTTIGINAYNNNFVFDEVNNEIVINRTDYISSLARYWDLDQYQEVDTKIKISYINCLICENGYTEEIIDDFNRIDFDNWVGNTSKIINNNMIDNINSVLSSSLPNVLQGAFDNGKNQGKDEGYQEGLRDNTAAFNQGYELGIGDNIIPKNIIGWFRILGRGIQNVLDIEILPYMKVGYIIGIPILFGLILFIIRLVRGD